MSGFLETKLCHRGFDERTNRCRITRKKNPGSYYLNSIPLLVPSENVVVDFRNSNITWYSVIVPVTGTLQADTESTLTNIDTKICIYNSDGSLFWQNDDSGNEPNPYLSNVSAPGLTAGTYYIVVGFTGMQFGENFTITTNNIQPQSGVVLNVSFTPSPESVTGLYPTNNNASKWTVVSSPDYDIPYLASPYYPGISTGYSTPGLRTYETTFDLSQFDVTTVNLRMSIEWGHPRQISLNGINIFADSGGNGYQNYVVNSSGSQSVLTGEGTGNYSSLVVTTPKAVGFLPGINTISITSSAATNVAGFEAYAVRLSNPPAPPPPPSPPTHNTPIPVPGLGGTPYLPGNELIPNWTVSSPNAVSSPYPATSYGYGGYIKGDGTGGPYSFHRTFDLTGFDVSTIVLRMDIYQGALQIMLNGTEIVPTTSEQYFVIKSTGTNSVMVGAGGALFNTPLQLTNSYAVGFVQGINTITIVRNGQVEVGDFRAVASPI